MSNIYLDDFQRDQAILSLWNEDSNFSIDEKEGFIDLANVLTEQEAQEMEEEAILLEEEDIRFLATSHNSIFEEAGGILNL
jgi:hypothetical protein